MVANDLPLTRVGITVTKKSGGAVTRNRIRRRIREIVRTFGPENRRRDVVVHVRPSETEPRFDPLREELTHLFQRALAGAPPVPRPR